jgi:hypothetical protein
VIISLGTIHLILEGIGAMLAMVGLGGSAFVTIAVLIGKRSEEVGRWGQIGTAIGFLFGIPAGIITVVVLSK